MLVVHPDPGFLQELWEATARALGRGLEEKNVAAIFLGIAAAEAQIIGSTRDEFLAAAGAIFDSTRPS